MSKGGVRYNLAGLRVDENSGGFQMILFADGSVQTVFVNSHQ